jgi:hypothetical protein
MSDAIFWLPEAKTFPELHCKIPLKHFFHREHRHPLSTNTLRQVPEALAQKMAEGLDFQKLTTTCTVSLTELSRSSFSLKIDAREYKIGYPIIP